MTATRWTFAVAVLTALGVLPVPSESPGAGTRGRSPLKSLNPIDLEGATVVAAVKQTPTEVRSGRLGH